MAISLINTSAVSAINGLSITLNIATATSCLINGDQVFVAMACPRAQTLVAYSSGGTAITPITSTFVSGNLNYGVFTKISTGGDLTIVCSNSGNAQDGCAAAYVVLRGAETYRVDAPDATATGTSTSPNPPQLTAPSTAFAIVACAASLSASTVTGIGGAFSTPVSTTGSDTRSTTIAMSWSSTPLSSNPYDPGVYGFSVSGAWFATSIAVAVSGSIDLPDTQPQDFFTKTEILGY